MYPGSTTRKVKKNECLAQVGLPAKEREKEKRGCRLGKASVHRPLVGFLLLIPPGQPALPEGPTGRQGPDAHTMAARREEATTGCPPARVAPEGEEGGRWGEEEEEAPHPVKDPPPMMMTRGEGLRNDCSQ